MTPASASKKVLVLPGDGCGPAVIAAAETVLAAAAPGLTLIHGEIGAVAYEHTGQVLPPETANLAAAADAILSGPVSLAPAKPEQRDPLESLRKQFRLLAEVREFYPLCEWLGHKDLDLVLVGMNPDSALSVTELDRLDGVSADYFASADADTALFDLTLRVAELRRRQRITCVPGSGLFPAAEKQFSELFTRHFAATEFVFDTMNAADAACRLATDPRSLDVVVAGMLTAPSLAGQAAGMAGGAGLMPVAYLGQKRGMFMPSHPAAQRRADSVNPTSAILAAAFMLLDLGMDDAYQNIKKAVREMYRTGRVTADRGGALTTQSFTAGTVELVRSYE
ncbi:MAG: isocitrate/isopropylmalate family dehydrogenase [Methanomethylophilus sp.]